MSNRRLAICPDDKIPMRTVTQPDLTYDECEKCGGLYFDQGALNQLITSVSGDVEKASLIDLDPVVDNHPLRACPVAPEHTMKKIEFLVHTDIVLDYCEACQGFFLDKGELEKANESLRDSALGRESDEFRKTVDGYLVVGKYNRGVSAAQAASVLGQGYAIPVKYISIGVYFPSPLGLGLVVTRETFPHRLGRFFGLNKEDLKTGDASFDDIFLVKAKKSEKALKALNPDVRARMSDFLRQENSVLQPDGSELVLNDQGLFYSEGPYSEEMEIDLESQAKPLVAALLETAQRLKASV